MFGNFLAEEHQIKNDFSKVVRHGGLLQGNKSDVTPSFALVD